MSAKKTTKSVSVRIERDTMKKLQGASTALSELASASIISVDLPLASSKSARA